MLEGGVTPSGKKSWMKGYSWRETEDQAASMARVRQDSEGVPVWERHIQQGMTQAATPSIGRSAVRPGAKAYEGFVPTPKGAKARKLSPS